MRLGQGDSVSVNGTHTRVLDVQDDTVTVDALPDQCPAIWIVDSHQIMEHVKAVWQTLWTRDTDAEQREADFWDSALNYIHHNASEVQTFGVDATSVPAWRHAIAKTNNTTAKGLCGFQNCNNCLMLRWRTSQI